MAINLHDEVRSNKRKSFFIVIMFLAFVGLIGGLAGLVFGAYSSGEFTWQGLIFGLVMAILVAGLYIWIFMSQGERMILKATGAKEADRKNYPYLYHTTEALSLAAGMSRPPKCYVIEDPALNAYATGFKPENSYIVVTTGLLKRLNRQEIEGVLAHEMSHIVNRDIRVMLLAAGLVGATVLLADVLFRMFLFSSHGGGGDNKDNRLMIFVIVFWVVLIVLSPIIAEMIRLSISRRREYLADSNGALLTRYPEGLASALEKIKGDSYELKNASGATAHLFISNPLKKGKKGSFLTSLFSTHPPIDDRIARLRGKKG